MLDLKNKLKYHFHADEAGKLVKCYHKSKAMLLSFEFWLATLIAFPLEHFIWEKVPGFSSIAKWLGLF